MNIVWRGPLTDPSGLAAGGRAFVRGLQAVGATPRVEHLVWHYLEAVTPRERELLADLIETPRVPADVHIQRNLARVFDPYAPGRLRVGHTSWESDVVPDDWAGRASQMDELWVPSHYNANAFIAAGVEQERIWVVPEPIERARFAPGAAEPKQIPGAHGTVFLSCFDWSRRKGWDVLLDAWVAAFHPDDDVTLIIKTWPARGLTQEIIEAQLISHLHGRGIDPARIADIVLIHDLFFDHDMAALYAACDVYITASRSEGFCRPAAEAMVAGRPVIAVDHSGPADFVDDSVGWPVGYRLVTPDDASQAESPIPETARWAEPDIDDFARALVSAHRDADGRATRAAAALDASARFDHLAIAKAALARLSALEPRGVVRGSRAVADDRPSALLCGSIFGVHSLAAVNRELARGIIATDQIELGLLDTEGRRIDTSSAGMHTLDARVAEVLSRVDVTIRHSYPPCFDPAPGRLVQFMHWEFGPAPLDWVRAHDEVLDEIWVATHWVRNHMVASGMDPDRVHVVPLGIEPERFRPGLEPLDLGEAAPGFRFLFVGGLIWRKGVDILFDAYERAFDHSDDVTLVIKDFGNTGPYAVQDGMAHMMRVVENPRAARVAHFTGSLAEDQLPRLYAASDCLVHPYRGEGYGLTIAEAMACGLPVIIPNLGAACDYTTDATAILVEAYHTVMPTMEIGSMSLADQPHLVEVHVDDLAAAMRRVYENRESAARVGAAAAEHMYRNHTWQRTAAAAAARITALAEGSSREARAAP